MQTVEGREVDAKPLALLDSDENPVFAAHPKYVTARRGQHWNNALLLLTDRRLLIARDKQFGRAKADFAASWGQISSVQGELWNGGGPDIQLLISTAVASAPIEVIVKPEYAVEVESAIRAGYLRAQG